MGYLSADKNDPNLGRKVLTGAATGAGIGALTGGLASSGFSKQVFEDARTEASEWGKQVGEAIGHEKGFVEATDVFSTNPEAAAELVMRMKPEMRESLEQLLNKINKDPMRAVFE